MKSLKWLNLDLYIVGVHEDSCRGLSEIEYQILNLLLQPKLLDLTCQACLTDEYQLLLLKSMGIEKLLGVLSVRRNDFIRRMPGECLVALVAHWCGEFMQTCDVDPPLLCFNGWPE